MDSSHPFIQNLKFGKIGANSATEAVLLHLSPILLYVFQLEFGAERFAPLSVNPLDLYDKFSNFFALIGSAPTIYLVRDPDSFDGPMVGFAGERYTWEHRETDELEAGDLEGQRQTQEIFRRMIISRFRWELRQSGYELRGMRYIAYHPDDFVEENNSRDIFDIFTGFEFRVLRIPDGMFLVLDPHLTIQMNASLEELKDQRMDTTKLIGYPIFYPENGHTRKGLLVEVSASTCRIRNEEFDVREFQHSRIRIENRPELIQSVLTALGRRDSVIRLQRKYSYLDRESPSQLRLAETIDIVSELRDRGVFPLNLGDSSTELSPYPTPLTMVRRDH